MGTSVTSTMISLANLSNLEQFRLGFSAATIHDLFNWCSILLLLPVEMGTGLLENISGTERFLSSSGTQVDILRCNCEGNSEDWNCYERGQFSL